MSGRPQCSRGRSGSARNTLLALDGSEARGRSRRGRSVAAVAVRAAQIASCSASSARLRLSSAWWRVAHCKQPSYQCFQCDHWAAGAGEVGHVSDAQGVGLVRVAVRVAERNSGAGDYRVPGEMQPCTRPWAEVSSLHNRATMAEGAGSFRAMIIGASPASALGLTRRCQPERSRISSRRLRAAPRTSWSASRTRIRSRRAACRAECWSRR